MRNFVAGLCTAGLIGGALLLGNGQSPPCGELDEAVLLRDETIRIEDETIWIKIVFGADGKADTHARTDADCEKRHVVQNDAEYNTQRRAQGQAQGHAQHQAVRFFGAPLVRVR